MRIGIESQKQLCVAFDCLLLCCVGLFFFSFFQNYVQVCNLDEIWILHFKTTDTFF